jgi:hypothetical protein
MKPHMGKKELVAMFMESPLYFDMLVRERLTLIRDHIRRFAFRASQSGVTTLVHSGPVEPTEYAVTRLEATEARHGAKIIVGYVPPAKVSVGT